MSLKGDIGIVGIGMAGAACARTLADQGITVTLYEKSRGHGGRVSTRYADLDSTVTFDHGAQYFTVREEPFRNRLDAWIEAGAAAKWAVTPAVIEDGSVQDYERETARYVGTPTMNQIVKHDTKNLDKKFKQRVTNLTRDESGWSLEFEDARPARHDNLVLTAPPAQSANLVSEACPDLSQELQSISMDPTWCLLLAFEAPVDVPFDAAFVNDGPLDWVANNASKPGRAETEAWVLHATSNWSKQHRKAEPDRVIRTLREAFAELTESPLPAIIYSDTHRWLYAKPTGPENLDLETPPTLELAGDWLNGSRVEGAYLSGREAAKRLIPEP